MSKTVAAALAMSTLVAITSAPRAHAASLDACVSQVTWSNRTVVYTGSCPRGIINAVSKNFYAKKPRIYGESFNKRFAVRMRRGETISISGTYGSKPVRGVRTRELLPNVRFALTATGRFGRTSVRCYATGKHKGPGVDQTKWYGLTVNGNPNERATKKAWKRCAFLVLVTEAFAYTAV